MKKSFLLLPVLVLVLVSFAVTGFQCGSASLTSAKLYISRQEWESAEKSLMTEVEKNPANTEAWCLLGDVRGNLGNYQGMVESYDKSVKSGPEFAKKIGEAKTRVWTWAMKRGVDSYNRSTKAPKDSAAMLRDSAIAMYKVAIIVLPDSLAAYQNMAIAYHVGGKFDDEITTLKSALNQKKDTETSITLINAYIRKAEAAKESGNKEETVKGFNDAISALTDARTLEPENTELLGTLINLYIEADRANEAIPLIREALARDPKNKVFQNNLGLLLLQTGEFEEATQHFEAAVVADENYEEGLWNGAVAYMKWGVKIKKDNEANADSKAHVEKFKSAVKMAEKLVSIKKDVQKYWEGLATAYANAGMGKEAQKAFEQAEALKNK